MLSGQGNVGLSAANNTSAAGRDYATGGGAAMGNIGAANASGYMGSGNAYSNAISNAMNNYNNMSMMNRLFPGQGSTQPQQPMAPSYASQNTVLNPNFQG
jgi:hypothetical protein